MRSRVPKSAKLHVAAGKSSSRRSSTGAGAGAGSGSRGSDRQSVDRGGAGGGRSGGGGGGGGYSQTTVHIDGVISPVVVARRPCK